MNRLLERATNPSTTVRPDGTQVSGRPVWPWVLVLLAFGAGYLLRGGGVVEVPVESERIGPRRLASGVAVGYDRTPAGAAAAAANYTEALSGSLIHSPESRQSLVRRIVSAPEQAQQLRVLEATAVASQRILGTPAFVALTPLATKGVSFAGDRAVVQVWRVGVSAGPNVESAMEVYATETVELAWEDGDWRYVRQTTTDGPTPLQNPESTVTPGKDLVAQVGGWERFWHAPIPE